MRFTILVCSLFLISCSKPETIKAVKPAKTSVESTVSSVNSGTVKAERVSELAFGAVGRVQRLMVKLGDLVHKDQVLAELENLDMKTAFENARLETERQKVLLASKNTSRLAYESSFNLLESMRIGLAKTFIKAPFDGIVSELNLEVGQLSQITAEFSKALMRIVDLEPRFVRCEIDEVDYSRVKVGMPARIKILAERREPFHGVIRKIVPFVSSAREQDRTTEVELMVNSEGRLLIAGASADVEIITAEQKNVLAVPARAVLGRGASKYVFIEDEGRVKKVFVTIGLTNYDRVEILKGLGEGQSVLIATDKNELVEGMKIKVELETWPS